MGSGDPHTPLNSIHLTSHLKTGASRRRFSQPQLPPTRGADTQLTPHYHGLTGGHFVIAGEDHGKRGKGNEAGRDTTRGATPPFPYLSSTLN